VTSAITAAFPLPGPVVAHAYSELDMARAGTDAQRQALGRLSVLPRPWDPPSCPPALRTQVWAWLDRVADWINHEYIWAPDRFIPSCWPAHPHIAHELAVIADLRRTAGCALTGDALEEWHRYPLPAFLDRVASRMGTCCGPAKHDDWPAAGRYRQFRSQRATRGRTELFAREGAPTLQREATAPPGSLVLANSGAIDTATAGVLGSPQ
jgi:hypothetical protein